MTLLPPTNASPSPASAPLWLRALHRLATAALGLALLLWMLLLLAAAGLYFWLIPHIDSLRPKVESFLSEQLRTPVQIERISVRSVQGFPTFDLHNLQILDSASQPQLKLAQVSATVSPLSLLQLKAERWKLDAPDVHIHRSAQGVWSIAGIAADPNSKPGAALDWVFSQKEIVIERARMSLLDDFLKQPQHTLSETQLLIQNGLRSHSILLETKLDKTLGQSVRIVGKFKQPLLDTHAGHWQAWAGELYAKLDAPQVAAFTPYAVGSKPLLDAAALLNGTAQIEVWGKIAPNKLLTMDVSALHIPTIARRLQLHAELDNKLYSLQGEQIDLASAGRVAKAAGLATHWQDYIERAKPMGQIKTLRLDASGNKVSAKFDLDSTDATGKIEFSLDALQAQSLELKAQLTRLELTAIPRFLPESLPLALRQYLQSGLAQGVAQDVSASVKVKDKTFKVSGHVVGAQFVFAPPSTGWPSIDKGKADIVLEASQPESLRLAIHNIEAQFAGLPVKGSVLINDLKKPVVDVAVQSKAPLPQLLAMLDVTPIKGYTQSVLSKAEGSGLADSKASITIPVQQLLKTTVKGLVQLEGASLRVNPITPMVSQLKGAVAFSETGFVLQNVSGKALGGDIKLSGNLQAIQAEGTLSAQGLETYARPRLSALNPLWPHIKGETTYKLSILPQAVDGNNIRFQSDLVGIALSLPTPMSKVANAAWPVQYQQDLTADRLQLSIAQWLQADQHLPQQGLGLMINAPALNLTAWQALMGDSLTGTTAQGAATSATALNPQRIAAHIGDLVIGARHFNQVVLGASRLGTQWRINASSSELDGYAEYRSGQLMARLVRLSIPDSTTQSQIEQFLTNEQVTLPALDVIVDQFDLGPKKLGRLEVQATNQRAVNSLSNRAQQEWRLQKLWLTNPDASFKGSGVWNGKSVDLPFNLDIHDSGDLLTRFGLPGTIKGGKGQLQGRIGWLGSPLALHYPSLAGQLKLDIAKGQFLKADPGVGRLLSVLSLQSLPRRLTLDFRDVFSEGFAFDSVSGEALIKEGVIDTQNMQMKSVLALVSLQGSADIAKETQDLRVLVLPDINAGGVSLLAAIVNPIVGVATYLTQLVLRRPVIAAATKEYHIEGSWRDPKVTAVPHGAK